MSKPLTPASARMARAALQWSLERAAKECGVDRSTVYRFENDVRYSDSTAEALKAGYLRTGRIAFPTCNSVTHVRIPGEIPNA